MAVRSVPSARTAGSRASTASRSRWWSWSRARAEPQPYETELASFADSEIGQRYPAAVATWQTAWERFISFLEFPLEPRKIIHTANSIKSLNYQLERSSRTVVASPATTR